MHYATHCWSDFVRGVTPTAVTVRMQEHLLAGCNRCNRTVNIFRKLTRVAAQPETVVPNATLRRAKAIFCIPRKGNAITTMLAKIVFDSFLEPMPAGVRSRAHMFRQAMFEAGDVLVDVRLENQSDGTFLVTGQVADRSVPSRVSGRVVLHLVSGGQRRRLEANRFGEFQTVYHADGDSKLEISGAGRNIEVPLSQVSGGAQAKSNSPDVVQG